MKRSASNSEPGTSQPLKKTRKGKEKQTHHDPEWPLYFTNLFKVFKALNTVLAFVSSRKQVASTFPSVRASVERLLKQPLKLSDVAELKALLPQVITFAYVPKNELLIHEMLSKERPGSPDFSDPRQPIRSADEEEHVLVLDFADNLKGSKTIAPRSYHALPSISPAATKKLVQKRNDRFVQAVNELLTATTPPDDPCILIQTAAREHIPVNPGSGATEAAKPNLYKVVPDTEERPSVSQVLEEVQDEDWYYDQIHHKHTMPSREARLASIEPPLSETIVQALSNSRGIETFYLHQVQAIRALESGKQVIVSTPTASGKSVIYQVPLLRLLEENPDAKAILVYPTKALAQDQKTALEQLLYSCPGLEHTRVDTYDGDTPNDKRKDIRENTSVILTNFDTIHASILPREEQWRSFLKNVKIFAVDELHYYNGLFGTHVAYIMRRFRRVCAAIGNRRIRYVSCSATISNPHDHMKQIFALDGGEIEVITEDGAPSPQKDFIVWGPPPIDPEAPNLGKKSSLNEATALMRFLMKRGLRVILFCKIRKVCELVRPLNTERFSDWHGYTALGDEGYNPEDRRKIERDAFTGQLLGLIATNALELGVDIGSLDVVIMLGFPMSLASFRQQAGRAGRRSRDSLAILVGDDVPLDNYYLESPEELFEKSGDDLLIDLESTVILDAHLQCAAQEMPLSNEDSQYFGLQAKEICESRLKKDAEGWYHTHPKYLPYPSRFISIRPIEETYVVVDISNSSAGNILEHIEVSRAMFEIYEGGIWMHRGLTFMTKQVDHDTKLAKVFKVDVNWITSPRDFTNVDPVQSNRVREIRGSPHLAYYGRIDVDVHVFGFFKIRNGRILDRVDVDTPSYHLATTGMWIDIPQATLDLLTSKNFLPSEGIHSASHAFLNRFALSQDARTECKNAEKEYMSRESERKRPARLTFYDPHQAGGVTAKAFDNVSNILQKAENAISSCPCEDGCSRCILSTRCKEKNTVHSKLGALIIIRSILDIPIDPDTIPVQFRDDIGRVHNTIIPAHVVGPSVPANTSIEGST